MRIWKLINRGKLQPDQAQRALYIKAFQKLWVAGTLGAYFTALWHTVPDTIVHLSQGYPPFDDAVVIALRYCYLLWLLFYFLASATNNEHAAAGRSRWDIGFDVMQSIGGLIAAFILGFTAPWANRGVTPYIVTNVVIFLICAVSLPLFSSSARPGVNWLRGMGAIISMLACVLCLTLPFRRTLILLLGACQALLLTLLGVYFRICLNEQPPGATTSAAAGLATASASAANAADAAAKAAHAVADEARALVSANPEI